MGHLQACESCGAQFDVGEMAAGSAFRCGACGGLVTVAGDAGGRRVRSPVLNVFVWVVGLAVAGCAIVLLFDLVSATLSHPYRSPALTWSVGLGLLILAGAVLAACQPAGSKDWLRGAIFVMVPALGVPSCAASETTHALVQCPSRATAKVTSGEVRWKRRGTGSSARETGVESNVAYSFRTEAGEEVVGRAELSERLSLGSEVEVRYDPESPVRNLASRARWPWSVLLMLAALGVGAAFVIWSRRFWPPRISLLAGTILAVAFVISVGLVGAAVGRMRFENAAGFSTSVQP